MVDVNVDLLLVSCPDCARPMRLLSGNSTDTFKEFRWICSVAMEAKSRGFLGQLGRYHKECLIFKLKELQG